MNLSNKGLAPLSWIVLSLRLPVIAVTDERATLSCRLSQGITLSVILSLLFNKIKHNSLNIKMAGILYTKLQALDI